jgi:phosphocarrier protein
MSAPVERSMRIVNQRGLHARASRKFAELCLTFQSRVTVTREDESADGTSLMDLMMLGAGIGADIHVRAEGPDAAAAIDALDALVADKFGEGE